MKVLKGHVRKEVKEYHNSIKIYKILFQTRDKCSVTYFILHSLHSFL